MRPPSLSFRGAKRRGNLGEAVAISPMAFLRSGRVLRDCHVGLRPPRNDKSGGQHCFNGGRYGSGVPSRDCHVGLRPPRNDKSGGQHCFNGGQYGSGVPSRDCHVASLLAMTNRRCVPFYDGSFRTAVPSRDCHVGLRPPRNDKSGGQHRFNGGRYGSGVPSRDCHGPVGASQ